MDYRIWRGLSVPNTPALAFLDLLPDGESPQNRSHLWDLARNNPQSFVPCFKDGKPTGEQALLATMLTAENGVTLICQERDYRRSTDGINVAGVQPHETTMLRFEDRFPGVSIEEVFGYIVEQLKHDRPVYYASAFCGLNFLNLGRLTDASVMLASAFGSVLYNKDRHGTPLSQVIINEFSWRDRFVGGAHADIHYYPLGINGGMSFLLKGSPFPGMGKKGPFGLAIQAAAKTPDLSAEHVSMWATTTPEGKRFGQDHKGNSGSGKSESPQGPKRDAAGCVALGSYMGKDVLPGWPLLRPQTLPATQYVDDIEQATIASTNAAHPVGEQGWWTPEAAKSELYLVGEDGEPIVWFMRADDFSEGNPFQSIEQAGRNNVFINFRRDGRFISPTASLSTNSRVLLPKADYDESGAGKMRVHIRRFGVRVNDGAGLGVLALLSPAAYVAWSIAGASLASSPSYSGSDLIVPNEGPGTVKKFHPGHTRSVIAKEVEFASKLGDSVRYVLVPNIHVGRINAGYNVPRIACQLTGANFDKIWTGTGFVDHIGGGLFGRCMDGIPEAAGVPMPNGEWFARPWEQPDLGKEKVLAWCEDIRKRWIQPLMQAVVFADHTNLPKEAVLIAQAACDGASEQQFASIF